MEYVLILFFQSLGIGFHVMQKVVTLGDKFPEKTVRQIFLTFWQEDWDTLTISGLIVLLDAGVHYVVFDFLHIPLNPEWYWQVGPFAIALVLGYAGQRLIYKWFGSAEKFLDNQVTSRIEVNKPPIQP